MDELEVDYDRNVTTLYKAISDSDWDQAIAAAKDYPEQARTWVVRYHPNSDSIMWRFLPLHSACAKQPPDNVISALVNAYERGAQNVDDQGMLPLHYACGNQASIEVIRVLLLANPNGPTIPDPHGMLPLHYLTQWGPRSLQVLDALLFANRNAVHIKDSEGSTPLDLARFGEYAEREEVAAAIQGFPTQRSPSRRGSSRTPTSRKSSFDHNDETRSPGKQMISSPRGNDAVARLQQATLQQQKSRDEYMRGSPRFGGEQRDDEAVHIGVFSQNVGPSTLQPARSFSTNPVEDRFDGNNADPKKLVAELKAEVERLRSASAMAEDDAKKTIADERKKMQESLDEMKAHLAKCQEEMKQSMNELDEKAEFGQLVDSRLGDKENELTDAMKKNENLRKDLETMKTNIFTYKTKTNKLDDHLSNLSTTMEGMMKEQEQIMKASARHEQHMKKVALMRQQKMQEFIDQEVQFARISLEKQKQNELGSEEMINKALEKQKKLMAGVTSVLNDSAGRV